MVPVLVCAAANVTHARRISVQRVHRVRVSMQRTIGRCSSLAACSRFVILTLAHALPYGLGIDGRKSMIFILPKDFRFGR